MNSPVVDRQGRIPLTRQVFKIDGVERLDDARLGQMGGEEFAGRGLAAVQFGHLPVPLRVVVVGVDDDLPRQRVGGEVFVAAEGDGNQDGLPELGGVLGRHRPDVRAEAGDQIRERLRAA